jgi:DNA helicase-2/ATP-dependent DNA helicase PcrA
MPFDPTVLIEADDAQKQAAHDSSPQVRVIAGPGTGKSFTIEERVAWLLQAKGIDANAIIAVSFTRASARDLKLRIYEACRNIPNIEKVRVGTLHSLGLTVLKKAGQLTQYPSSPMVLSDWETENIFDVEFRNLFGYGKKRAAMIRKFREAFWFSGEENPSSYVAPDPAVSDAELSAFISFHGPRTQVYSCVLPGEIVQQCVEKAETGLLDVVGHAGCAHLIVDEFQDLNPMDLRFIELFIESSVPVFVAGDDDQSVYSFRYASPDGLQDFCAEHSGSGDHELRHCFRCATSILKCATTLIERNGGTSRVPKHPLSVYSSSSPQIEGTLKLLKFLRAKMRRLKSPTHALG